MAGCLTQLSAIGVQSNAITGGDYSVFTTVVRRMTPYASEPKEINFNGTPQFGRTAIASITRSADLLSKVWLVLEIGKIEGGQWRYINDIGKGCIERINLEAGSINYQTITPEWMYLWETLTTPTELMHRELTGRRDGGTQDLSDLAGINNRFYVPIPFFFSRTYGHSLPIVALHLTDILIKVKFKKKDELYMPKLPLDSSATVPGAGDLVLNNAFLMGEYIYLSDDERKRFAVNSHAYLIEQTQLDVHSIPSAVDSYSAKLQFNHPCKAFYWFLRNPKQGSSSYTQNGIDYAANDWTNWKGELTSGTKYVSTSDAFETATIKLNNNTRVPEMGPKYFRLVQPKAHHSNLPGFSTGDDDCFLYMYSFCMSPESVQPTGHLNCSRVETISLDLKFGQALANMHDLYVYAQNYNIVRIQNGISSLAWAS